MLQQWSLCEGFLTKRLVVHLAKESDLPDILGVLTEPVREGLVVDLDTFRTRFLEGLAMGNDKPMRPDFLPFAMSDGGNELFFVARKGADLVGVMGLTKDPAEAARQLGSERRHPDVFKSYFVWVAIAESFQNQQFATEALTGLVTVSFEYLRARYLFWNTLSGNVASQALAARLNFTPCPHPFSMNKQLCFMRRTENPGVLRDMLRR